MTNSDITCESVIKKLHLVLDDVYNVYCIGSRLWWPHLITAQTDYDYYIVVKGKGIKINTHVSNIDAMIVSTDVYDGLLDEHHFLTIVTQFMSVCSNKMMEKYRPRFKFDPKKLKTTLIAEMERDKTIAKKHFSKSNPIKAMKILNYCKISATVYENIVNTKTIFNNKQFVPLTFDNLNIEQLDPFFDRLIHSID